MTINEAMVLQRTLRGRIQDLSTIRNANAVRTRRWDMLSNGQEKERTEVEPQYDPRKVDAKVVELETFLFKLDAAVKQANARTELNIAADIDKLLAPIE